MVFACAHSYSFTSIWLNYLTLNITNVLYCTIQFLFPRKEEWRNINDKQSQLQPWKMFSPAPGFSGWKKWLELAFKITYNVHNEVFECVMLIHTPPIDIKNNNIFLKLRGVSQSKSERRYKMHIWPNSKLKVHAIIPSHSSNMHAKFH